MNFKESFQIAAGSTIGRLHRERAMNNQDSLAFSITDDAVIAVVSDGVSNIASGPKSEFGSCYAANILHARLANFSKHAIENTEQALERARQELFAHMRLTANAFGGSFTDTVDKYFLFTLLGAVITETGFAVFSIGDGVYSINGQSKKILPLAGNEPPCLAYALNRPDYPNELLKFEIHCRGESEALDTLIIGTDGIANMGSADIVLNDDFFDNTHAVSRYLKTLNQDTVTPDWKERKLIRTYGKLSDDATLIAIRRIK